MFDFDASDPHVVLDNHECYARALIKRFPDRASGWLMSDIIGQVRGWLALEEDSGVANPQIGAALEQLRTLRLEEEILDRDLIATQKPRKAAAASALIRRRRKNRVADACVLAQKDLCRTPTASDLWEWMRQREWVRRDDGRWYVIDERGAALLPPLPRGRYPLKDLMPKRRRSK